MPQSAPPPSAAPEKEAAAKTSRTASRVPYLAAATGAAAVLLVIAFFWLARGGAHRVESAPREGTARSPTRALATATENLPVAPGKIATIEELGNSWSSEKFLYRTSSGDTVPALVVRLPGNTYWAFSLREPYGPCELKYITKASTLRSEYDFEASYPMVGDPCSHTVYDLTKYGEGPNGLVRGAVVSGSGVRPPLAIEVQVRGKAIFATRAESQ